jgi:predicted nucleotidyltransferase
MSDTVVVLRAMHEKPVDMNERIIRFFRKRPEVVAVYLFGSQARERATEVSDVDLAILLDPQAAVDLYELKRDLLIGLSRILRNLFNIQMAIQFCIDTASDIISDEGLDLLGSTNEMFYTLQGKRLYP